MSARNPIVRFLSWLWRGLNVLRRVLHLILLLAIFTALLIGIAGPPVRIPGEAALVIDPRGPLVEELEGDPLDRALGELQGNGLRQALVRDVVESLESATTDDRIKAVVLRLEELEGGGLPKLQAVAHALDKVRAAGKKVIALGDSYDQGQYYLAAHADEIYLNDLGIVYIDGFGYYRTYFKGVLEKLRVDLNVFRVGEYKSFVEPFIRDDMSEEDKTSSRRWLQALWSAYQRDVVAARKLAAGSLEDYANNFPALLEKAAGSGSRAALDNKLVDGLMSRQQFRDYMIGLVGEADDDDDYSGIDYRSYLLAVRRTAPPALKADNVGVIVASGQIVDGEAPAGAIGGDTLADLIRQAGTDDSLKALVLRVDSPGGSMFASEVVRAELEDFKVSGKPLVVSMGSLAASGGYYISMPADEIWANESTITGSIGVGALVPTLNRGLDALGVHVDGIGTTKLSGQLRLDRPLGEDAKSFLNQSVHDAYRIFVRNVADSRKLEFQRVDEIARGRVWIGGDAHELGLVDSLGDLSAAIDAAARRAELDPDSYGVTYVEPEMSLSARLLRQYSVQVLESLGRLGLTLPRKTDLPLRALAAAAEQEWRTLSAFNDPRGVYYYCLCDAR